MGESRQPHLNGAYYGPSVPPPSKTYHRPGRGGGGGCCCCCNPFSCLCNCLCTCLYQIICTILVILVVIGVIGWFIFRPNNVKFYATDASLTEFTLNNNTLHYNLALNLTIRNPNSRLGIYYDQIEASPYYEGQRLTTVELETFYQGHKNTTDLGAEFRGQNLVVLGDGGLSNYQSDRNAGMYDIDVKLRLRIRLKFLIFKSSFRLKPKIDCNLSVPLHSNGTSSGVYESKRCEFDWR